jgi:hypothetical protein
MKRVDGHDNAHSAWTYRNPLGAECEGCGHRALIELDMLGQLDGNMKLLKDFKFKCASCGSRDVSLWLFVKRPEADDWVQTPGPGF